MRCTTIKRLFLFSVLLLPLLPVTVPVFSPPWALVATAGELILLDGETFTESGSTRIWKLFRSKRVNSPEQVDQYLSSLNNLQDSSWRLPTRDELFRLFSKFDLKKNGDVKVEIEGNYRHTDDKGMITVGAWEIGDQCGPERLFYPAKSGYVWAVATNSSHIISN